MLASVTARTASGANGLAWNGPGINISAAAGEPSHLTALGVMFNDDGLGGAYRAAFNGEMVGRNDVIVKYTYYGDADLSGTVDGTDYALIDNAFNSQGAPLGGLANVPEPAGVVLMGVGLFALAMARIARRRCICRARFTANNLPPS